VDDPLYVIQSDLTNGEVLQGGRSFIAKAKTTKKESRLVNADPEQSHLDPLMASENDNAFFETVIPFLKKKVFPLAERGKLKRKRGKGKKD
jgi:hypothetical protein